MVAMLVVVLVVAVLVVVVPTTTPTTRITLKWFVLGSVMVAVSLARPMRLCPSCVRTRATCKLAVTTHYGLVTFDKIGCSRFTRGRRSGLMFSYHTRHINVLSSSTSRDDEPSSRAEVRSTTTMLDTSLTADSRHRKTNKVTDAGPQHFFKWLMKPLHTPEDAAKRDLKPCAGFPLDDRVVHAVEMQAKLNEVKRDLLDIIYGDMQCQRCTTTTNCFLYTSLPVRMRRRQRMTPTPSWSASNSSHRTGPPTSRVSVTILLFRVVSCSCRCYCHTKDDHERRKRANRRLQAPRRFGGTQHLC